MNKQKNDLVFPDNIVADRHEVTGKWVMWYLTDEQAKICSEALKIGIQYVYNQSENIPIEQPKPAEGEHRVTSRANGYGDRDCSCGGVWNDNDKVCSTLKSHTPTQPVNEELLRALEQIANYSWVAQGSEGCQNIAKAAIRNAKAIMGEGK